MSHVTNDSFIYFRKCPKCVVNPVCSVSITVWDGTGRQGGRVLALCGECFDKFAEEYNLKDDNGNFGKNFTLDTPEYEEYLKEKENGKKQDNTASKREND